MHEGLDSKDLDYAKKNEFVIDQVGNINRKNYQNFGIEFHRYINDIVKMFRCIFLAP